jgi:hypothetical protein
MVVAYQAGAVSAGEFQVLWVVVGRLAAMMEAGSERLLTEGYEGVVTVEWLSICRAS